MNFQFLLPESARVVSDAGSVFASNLQRTCRRELDGAGVALCGDAVDLLRWLVALDGLAKRVVVVPRTADRTLWEMVARDGQVDVLAKTESLSTGLGSIEFHELHAMGLELLPLPCDDSTRSVIEPLKQKKTETEWVLTTSGTTSTPKLVAHSLASLTRSMKLDPRFAEYRWGLLYDPARFAGLQVFLQALLNGATLLAPGPQLALPDQIGWLAQQNCDALSATPTLWRKILMTSEAQRLALRQITLGGEIADEPTIRGLTNRFPQARLTHVYASTEAGVGFAVHDRKAGFPAEWLGREVRGIGLRKGDNGCLWLAPGRISQRYLGQAAGQSSIAAKDGWIDTGDAIRVTDGRVFFCGRLNGSINVGGNKVFPEEIENVVLEVEGVAAASARGKPNSVMGNLVEVLIVATSDAPSDLSARVKAHCKLKLENYKVPAFVKVVQDIDVSAAGKTLR